MTGRLSSCNRKTIEAYANLSLIETKKRLQDLEQEINYQVGRGKYAHLNREFDKLVMLAYQLKFFIGDIEYVRGKGPLSEMSNVPEGSMIRVIK